MAYFEKSNIYIVSDLDANIRFNPKIQVFGYGGIVSVLWYTNKTRKFPFVQRVEYFSRKVR